MDEVDKKLRAEVRNDLERHVRTLILKKGFKVDAVHCGVLSDGRPVLVIDIEADGPCMLAIFTIDTVEKLADPTSYAHLDASIGIPRQEIARMPADKRVKLRILRAAFEAMKRATNKEKTASDSGEDINWIGFVKVMIDD